MPNNKTSGFRIFGDELGREVSYIDVTISGTDRSGQIYLEEIVSDGSTPEEWIFTDDEISELFEKELVIESNNIPVEGHSMWTTLEEIGNTRAAVDINNFVDQNLRDSARSLFRALIEAGK